MTANQAHSGRERVFRNADLTSDVLLASACLPTLFQALEIDGELYWDGGYAGNSTITPLVPESEANDTIRERGSPVKRTVTPRSAREIIYRVNEIAFNAPRLKELRIINAEWAFVSMLRDERWRAASAFLGELLGEHGGCLGKRSSFHFDDLFDGVVPWAH